jgi:peptide-methionine (S)-S-oxide reductase
MRFLSSIFFSLILFGCVQNNKAEGPESKASASRSSDQAQASLQDGLEVAYFASGCFWCVEAIYEHVKGVSEVESGYAGGTEKNPTYTEVSYGRTSHAEAVRVYYDPTVVSFGTLVDVFFGSHDPTTLNRQGPDRGAQYRSIAFYRNEEEKRVIESKIKALEQSGTFSDPIVTQVVPFEVFYLAEDYHQDFEKRNPYHPYIMNVSIPRLNRFKAKFPELLKEKTDD